MPQINNKVQVSMTNQQQMAVAQQLEGTGKINGKTKPQVETTNYRGSGSAASAAREGKLGPGDTVTMKKKDGTEVTYTVEGLSAGKQNGKTYRQIVLVDGDGNQKIISY